MKRFRKYVESIRTAPKIDMSSQEAWDKSNAEIEKMEKRIR